VSELRVIAGKNIFFFLAAINQFCLAGQVLTLFFEANWLWRSGTAGKKGRHGPLASVQGKA
jgi:hypothetical protein